MGLAKLETLVTVKSEADSENSTRLLGHFENNTCPGRRKSRQSDKMETFVSSPKTKGRRGSINNDPFLSPTRTKAASSTALIAARNETLFVTINSKKMLRGLLSSINYFAGEALRLKCATDEAADDDEERNVLPYKKRHRSNYVTAS